MFKLIAVDFDGTVVDHAFPEIGEIKPYAIEVLKALQENGHGIILNTCREDCTKRKFLTEAVELLERNGINLRSVNVNLEDDDFRDPRFPRRKIYAKMYIDDRNFGGFPGWDFIGHELLGMKIGRFANAE